MTSNETYRILKRIVARQKALIKVFGTFKDIGEDVAEEFESAQGERGMGSPSLWEEESERENGILDFPRSTFQTGRENYQSPDSRIYRLMNEIGKNPEDRIPGISSPYGLPITFKLVKNIIEQSSWYDVGYREEFYLSIFESAGNIKAIDFLHKLIDLVSAFRDDQSPVYEMNRKQRSEYSKINKKKIEEFKEMMNKLNKMVEDSVSEAIRRDNLGSSFGRGY